MVEMACNGPSPHSPSLRFGLPARQPSRCHHAQSLLGTSFHDPRTHHVLESYPKPLQAAPLSHRDDERWPAIGSHSTLALRLHLAACSPSSSCRFWVLDHLCSNLSHSFHLCWITEIRSQWTCVCVFTFSSTAFAFLIEMNFSFKSLFAIWSSSPQRFHYYVFLSIVSWQYQKYSTIPILVWCLLCVTPLVCSFYSSFAPSSPFFSSWWQKIVSYLHIHFLQCSPSTSSRQHQTTRVQNVFHIRYVLVFADSRIALLCRALRICVAHASTESCPFSLLVHWAFRACYTSHLPLLKSPRKWRKCNLISGDGLCGQQHGLAMNWVDRPRTSADERMLSAAHNDFFMVCCRI